MELAVDGRAVPIPKRQHRRVLAALLVHSGSLVSTDALIEVLWPDHPPERPLVTVHSAIAHLRRAMEPHRPKGSEPRWLRTESPGYRLVTAADEVDAHRFEADAAAGRAALDDGDPATAHKHLTAALRQWRGPALAEFADEPFAVAAARRLEEVRIDAVEARVAADLACGHLEVAAELDALVAEHPFRERLWEHLLVALYRSGRQAEALRRFQEVRGVFVEAGLEPDQRLVEVDAAIARRDADVLSPAAGGRPHPAPAAATAPGPREERRTGWAGSDLVGPGLMAESTGSVVGRTAEAEWFDDIRRSVSPGTAVVLVVAGEPGIGKSMLLAEAARRAAEAGSLVLGGRCTEDRLLPHEPFVQALTPLVAVAGEPELAALGEHRTHLARLLPGAERLTDRDEDPAVEPDTSRYLAYQAVAALLDAAGRDRLTLLAVDDLQWATPSTLGLLRHLVDAPPAGGLLVAGAYRDTEVTDDHPLTAVLDELRRSVPVHERTLGGLSPSEVRELMGRWGVEPPDDLAAAVHQSTDGHPLFVGELTRAVEPGWRPGLTLPVPENVRGLIRRRAGRLGASTRQLLEVASLLGRTIDLDLVASLVGRPATDLGADVDAAVDAGLLVAQPAGQPAFRHDLVRQVLEDAVPAAGRAAQHRAIADAILARSDDPTVHLPALAHHYACAASDGDPRRAIEFALRAGHQAFGLLAHEEAAARFRTGLDALEQSDITDEPGRLALLIGWLEAQRRLGVTTGSLGPGVEAVGLARRVGTPAQVADAARGAVATTWADRGAAGALAEVLDQVLADLHGDRSVPDAPDEVAASLRVTELLMSMLTRLGRHDHAVELARQVRAMAGAVDQVDLQVEVLTGVVDVLVNEDPLPHRLAATDEVLGLAGRSRNRETHALAYATARYVRMEALDERADELAAAYETAVDELGMPRYLAGRAQRQAMLAHLAGRFDEAEAASDEMVQHQPTREFFEAYAAQRFAVRLAQGRLEEMLPMFEQLGGMARQPVWRAARGWALAELDRDDEARAVLVPLVPRLVRLPRDPLWLIALVAAAHGLAAVGGPGDGGPLIDLLTPEAPRLVIGGTGATCLGSTARALGPLALKGGDPGAAAGWCRQAIEADRRLGAVPYLVEDRLWLARALQAGARAEPGEAARALVASALADAAELGMASRIVREAANAEGMPPPAVASPP